MYRIYRVSEPTVLGVAELLLPLMRVFQIVSVYVTAVDLGVSAKNGYVKNSLASLLSVSKALGT